jgi:hypothetical protein
MTMPKDDPARAALIPVTFVLRRPQGDRPDYRSAYDYYEVLDGGREVGRIYRINPATEIWWWDVWFQPTGRKSCADADTRERALAAFRAVCEPWLKQPPGSSAGRHQR